MSSFQFALKYTYFCFGNRVSFYPAIAAFIVISFANCQDPSIFANVFCVYEL